MKNKRTGRLRGHRLHLRVSMFVRLATIGQNEVLLCRGHGHGRLLLGVHDGLLLQRLLRSRRVTTIARHGLLLLGLLLNETLLSIARFGTLTCALAIATRSFALIVQPCLPCHHFGIGWVPGDGILQFATFLSIVTLDATKPALDVRLRLLIDIGRKAGTINGENSAISTGGGRLLAADKLVQLVDESGRCGNG